MASFITTDCQTVSPTVGTQSLLSHKVQHFQSLRLLENTFNELFFFIYKKHENRVIYWTLK